MVDEKLKKAAFKEGECVCFDLASSKPYLAAAGVICAVPRPCPATESRSPAAPCCSGGVSARQATAAGAKSID